MAALAQALKAGQKLEDVRLLSVGTGVNPRVVEGTSVDWGWLRWAKTLLDIMLDGSMLVSHYQCMQLLGFPHYWRINEALDEEIALDDCDSAQHLIDLANAVKIDQALAWISD
jgi:hypothetical protein